MQLENRAVPKTLSDEPRRKKPRTLVAEPICMMSSTDRQDPIREIPNTLTLLPKRAQLRIDTVEPMCTKSRTLKVYERR